jgi:hypothetical protein
VEVSVIQKFLPRPGKSRFIVSPDQAVERLPPLQGETFQLLKEMAIDQRFRHTPLSCRQL